MKISIDTKEDSHDEIKKVVAMLQNILGESQSSTVFDSDSSYDSPSETPKESPQFFNMFGDNSSSETTETEDSDSNDEPENNDIFSSTYSDNDGPDESTPDETEESDSIDIPEIVPY